MRLVQTCTPVPSLPAFELALGVEARLEPAAALRRASVPDIVADGIAPRRAGTAMRLRPLHGGEVLAEHAPHQVAHRMRPGPLVDQVEDLQIAGARPSGALSERVTLIAAEVFPIEWLPRPGPSSLC